jgi:hypothetical protein
VANFKEQRDLLRAINAELGKQTSNIKNATKEVTKLESVTRKLQDVTEGNISLTDKQAEKEAERARAAFAALQREANALQESLNTRQRSAASLTAEEKNLLVAKRQRFTVEKQVVKAAEKEVEIREGVRKSLGLTGVLAKSLNKTLGIDLSSALEDAQNEARKVNEEFENSAKSAGDVGKKSAGDAKVAGLAFKGLATSAANSIASIQGIFGGLVASFLKFNAANREARQLTGQTADNFTVLNDSILNAADQVKTITALSSELGINVNAAFSPETIAAASELTQLLGISEQSTAALAQTSEAFGQNLANAEKDAVKQAKAINASGRGVVNFQQVLEESGNASGRLQLSLGKTPGALQEAAAEAKALGLNLAAVENVADGLLNFEQSIAAELEAELLTGKQINLDRARSLALNNDIAGLSKEIAGNQEILAAFADGNRIQQNAVSKALGLSSDEISQIIFKQKIASGLSTEQAAKAADINVEDAKRLEMQEQFQKSLEKLTMAAAPLVEKFAALLSNTAALKFIIGGIAAIKLGGLISQFASVAAAAQKVIVPLLTSNALSTGGFGIPIALAAAGAGLLAYNVLKNKNKSADDGVIDAQGGLVVSGPKGSVSLNREDTIVANKNGVIAGTNLGGGGGQNLEMLSRLDRLISATEKGSQITMDGNLVGKSIANNTSRLG